MPINTRRILWDGQRSGHVRPQSERRFGATRDEYPRRSSARRFRFEPDLVERETAKTLDVTLCVPTLPRTWNATRYDSAELQRRASCSMAVQYGELCTPRPLRQLSCTESTRERHTPGKCDQRCRKDAPEVGSPSAGRGRTRLPWQGSYAAVPTSGGPDRLTSIRECLIGRSCAPELSAHAADSVKFRNRCIDSKKPAARFQLGLPGDATRSSTLLDAGGKTLLPHRRGRRYRRAGRV